MFPIPTKVAAIGSAIGTALVVGVLAYGLHSCSMDKAVAEKTAALAAQKTALVADCQSDKNITQGTDNAIQNDHDVIDGVLSVRLRDNTAPACVPVTGDPIGVAANATTGNVHPTPRPALGVSRAELYKLTADADKVRADLLQCRAFLGATWKAKGQAN